MIYYIFQLPAKPVMSATPQQFGLLQNTSKEVNTERFSPFYHLVLKNLERWINAPSEKLQDKNSSPKDY